MDEDERAEPWNFHTCKTCSYRSKSAFQMCVHVRMHQRRSKIDTFICDSEILEMFECEFCEIKTNLRVNLAEHFRVFHEEKEENDEMRNILKCFQCKNCDFNTHSLLVLTKHADDCNVLFKNNSNVEQETMDKAKKKGSLKSLVLVRRRSPYLLRKNVGVAIKPSSTRIVAATDKNETTKDKDSEEVGENEVIIETIVVNTLETDEETADHNSKDTVPPLKKKYEKKKEYCIFCHNLKTNMARHFAISHKNESKVKEFLKLKKGSQERAKLITKLRNLGNFEYNKQNKTKPILVRQKSNINSDKVKERYLPCPNCKGTFAKNSLKLHFRRCNDKETNFCYEKGRSLIREARILTLSLPRSKKFQTLIEQIMPPMNHDEIFNTVISDKTILLFGNHYIPKYLGGRQYMIRHRMRFIARYLLIVKRLCPEIKELKDLFSPKYFATAIEASKELAEYDSTKREYGRPYNELQILRYLKVLASIVQTEHIKRDDKVLARNVTRFTKRLTTYSPLLNKLAHNDLCEKRKNNLTKEINIPLSSDILKFKQFLQNRALSLYNDLNAKFEYQKWKNLSEIILLYIVVSNRKTAGEAENILYDDFKNCHRLSNTSLPKIFENLGDTNRKTSKSMFKIIIKGKLNRNVEAFISYDFKTYLDCVVKYREAVGVTNNEYLFALPGRLSGGCPRKLRTCALMRKYTEIAELQRPEALRTGLLRKHLATQVSTMNLDNADRQNVQQFMGHFGQSTVTNDLKMAKLLNRDAAGTASDTNCNTSWRFDKRDQSDKEACDNIEKTVNLKTPILFKNEVLSGKQEVEKNNYLAINRLTEKNPRHDTEEEYDVMMKTIKGKNFDSDSEHEFESSESSELEDELKQNSRRLRWTSPERDAAKRYFANAIKSGKEPKMKNCQEAIESCPELKARTAEKLKSWISHYIKKQNSDMVPLRHAWTTAEKNRVRSLFANILENGDYPSLYQMQSAIDTYPELKRRTVETMRSFIQHEHKIRIKRQN